MALFSIPIVSAILLNIRMLLKLTTYADDSCILLSPRKSPGIIDNSVVNKIAIHLSTRFGRHNRPVPVEEVRKVFTTDCVEQWACVRRLEGGDDMHASTMYSRLPEDHRDATFIRVTVPRRLTVTFFTYLQFILV